MASFTLAGMIGRKVVQHLPYLASGMKRTPAGRIVGKKFTIIGSKFSGAAKWLEHCCSTIYYSTGKHLLAPAVVASILSKTVSIKAIIFIIASLLLVSLLVWALRYKGNSKRYYKDANRKPAHAPSPGAIVNNRQKTKGAAAPKKNKKSPRKKQTIRVATRPRGSIKNKQKNNQATKSTAKKRPKLKIAVASKKVRTSSTKQVNKVASMSRKSIENKQQTNQALKAIRTVIISPTQRRGDGTQKPLQPKIPKSFFDPTF